MSFGNPQVIFSSGSSLQATPGAMPGGPAPSPVPSVDAFDYGANGNGVTDDSIAVQAAINAASSLAGGVGYVNVVLRSGYTFLLGSLTPKNNVRIWCYGAKLRLNPTALQAMFFANAGTLSNFEIRGGTFSGTGVETAAQLVFQVNTPAASQDINIYDTLVTNWATGVFYFGNCVRGRAINNTLINCCVASGINAINFVSQLAGGTTQTCIVIGNIVLGCGAAAIAYVNTGTTANTESRVVVTGNICESNSTGPGAAIDIEFSAALIGEGSKHVIADNVAFYTGSGAGYGITVNGSSGSDAFEVNRVVVKGNAVDSTAGGIQINASSAVCDSNVISISGAGNGIFAGKTKANPTLYQTISNNIIRAATTITVDMIASNFAQHLRITGNLLACDAGATSVAAVGIHVSNGGWIEILDNTISRAPRHGIQVSTTNDYDIRGNRVYNPSEGGAGGLGIFTNSINASLLQRITGNSVIDDRGGHLMGNAISGVAGDQVTSNTLSGSTGALITGAVTTKSANQYSTGAAAGRAVLVAGTVTVNTAEIQATDNILLTVVVPGGTRGEIQVGTIVGGTSFVINSIQPGTASTIQNLDTSTVYWKIDH